MSPRTRTIVATAVVGVGPHDAVAAGSTWFVGNEFANTVSVVHGGAAVARFAVGVQPGGLDVARVGALAVVAVRQRVLDLYSTTKFTRLARRTRALGRHTWPASAATASSPTPPVTPCSSSPSRHI